VSENYFDERVAATYEAKWLELSEPAVVDPAVSAHPEVRALPVGFRGNLGW
jgi:hypothetical protein